MATNGGAHSSWLWLLWLLMVVHTVAAMATNGGAHSSWLWLLLVVHTVAGYGY